MGEREGEGKRQKENGTTTVERERQNMKTNITWG